MQRITHRSLFAAAATLAVSLFAAAPSQANTGVIETDGIEAEAPEHLVAALSGNMVLFETSDGTHSCDTLIGEGTVDEPHIDGVTEVGTIDELDVTNSGSQDCPSDVAGVSSCDPTVDVPSDLWLEPGGAGPTLLVLYDQELHLDCATIIGTVECHYSVARTEAAIVGGTNMAVIDDPWEASGGSGLCPEELTLEMTVVVGDEDANPIGYEGLD